MTSFFLKKIDLFRVIFLCGTVCLKFLQKIVTVKYHMVAANLHKFIADTNVCVRANLSFNSLCNPTVLLVIDLLFLGIIYSEVLLVFLYLSPLYFP